MKKRVICLIAAAIMLVSFSGLAYAANTDEYDIEVSYPSIGSAHSSGPVTATGGLRPWVKPSKANVTTTYWIIPNGSSTSNMVTLHHVVTGTTTQLFFSGGYLSGYGGNGSRYQLVAGCSEQSYDAYRAVGTWSPD